MMIEDDQQDENHYYNFCNCNLWRLREHCQTKSVKCSSSTQTVNSGDRTVYPKNENYFIIYSP